MSGLGDYDMEPQDDLEEADPDKPEQPIGAYPDPAVALSPVTPLGFLGGKVVFAMPEGEIRMEPAAKIGTMLRTDIFACAAGQAFLTSFRDKEGKFLRDIATVWFNRKCREAGLWDTNRTVRSLGVWPGPAGTVVLHKGDQVFSIGPDGKTVKASVAEMLKVAKGPMYRLRPPTIAPGKPCKTDVGAWARDRLELWRWEPIGSDGLTGADVVLGWVGGALLGGFAPFRGHLMIDAMAGSGKTTLVSFVHALLSALAGEVIDSFSDAGFRSDLAGMARPVLLDEAEGSPGGAHGPGPVERALETLRRMATGQGGNRKQGDMGGGTVTQTAVGAAMLAGINAPRLGPADATRFVQVRLLALNGGSPPRPLATAAQLAEVIETAQGHAPAILGRALRSAHRYRADVAAMQAAMGKAGEAPRTADLISMLAAGRRLFLSDEPLSPEAAEDELAFWRPLLEARAATEVVSNPGADAFAHLMAWETSLHAKDRRVTIGELVERWTKAERDGIEDVLKVHGLRVGYQDGAPWLSVANSHPNLERIFEKTVWRDWNRTLRYLGDLGEDYAPRPTKPQWFGLGVKQRALAVPLAPWLKRSNPGSRSGEASGVPSGVPGQVHDEFD